MTEAMALPGGGRIPLLGFGTFLLKGQDAYRAVSVALETGYRHIDTAKIYGNEEQVGRAIAASGLRREEIFVTTKYAMWHPGGEHRAIEGSLERLGLERVDLWLVHHPVKDTGERTAIWDAFCDVADQGPASNVGVSNHDLGQIDQLTAATGRTPAVNQIRLNPPLYDPAVVAGHRMRGVVVEGHSPLRMRKPGLAHPVLADIAAIHDTSPAAVVIAWNLAHRVVVIPKSAHPDRIAANHAAADLPLTDDEIARIDTLGVTPTHHRS